MFSPSSKVRVVSPWAAPHPFTLRLIPDHEYLRSDDQLLAGGNFGGCIHASDTLRASDAHIRYTPCPASFSLIPIRASLTVLQIQVPQGGVEEDRNTIWESGSDAQPG